MADAQGKSIDRSVTDPWIKVNESNPQRRRGSKSSYELGNLRVKQAEGIDKERIKSETLKPIISNGVTKSASEKRQRSKERSRERSVSSKSNNRIDDNDLDEYDPDLYITEEEKKAFEYMLNQKREDMENREKKFENWVDSITRRRMFALSRMRKLGQGRQARLKFYGQVENYVRDMESLNSATPASNDSSASDTNRTSSSKNKVKVEDVQRQDTGIVQSDLNTIADDSSINSESNNQVRQHTEKEQIPKETPVIVPVES